jgi:hypothetical protein
MSPTAYIARDLKDDAILAKMKRESYAGYKKAIEAARERAAKYKEKAKCHQ